MQVFPYAGQRPRLWRYPQNWDDIIPALLSFAFPRSFVWLYPLFNPSSLTTCTSFSSFKTLSCAELISAARQISRQPSKVSSASLRSHCVIIYATMPQTIRSRVNPSFKSPNSHIADLLRKSVANASIDSPSSWFLEKNECLSKLSSSWNYSTAQTSSLLFHPLYSHRRHWPTEMSCKLRRPLVPPRATVSSLEPFHIFFARPDATSQIWNCCLKHCQFSAKFPATKIPSPLQRFDQVLLHSSIKYKFRGV